MMRFLRRLCVLTGIAAATCTVGADANLPPPAPPALHSNNPPVWVMMESASAPFGYLDANGQATGFAIELLRAIATDQGLKLRLDLRPWQTVYDDFRAGRGDVLGLVAYSEERAQLMDFSVPFEVLYCGTYIAKDTPDIDTLSELAGRRLAVIRNAITHEYVERHPELNVIILPYDTLAQCLDAVRSGQADAALGMNIATDHVIRMHAIQGIRRTHLEIREINYRLSYAVQRGNTQLLARINEGLANVRASGDYDRLYLHWLGPLQPRALRWSDLRPYAIPVGVVAILMAIVFGLQRWMLKRVSSHAQALRESEERLSLVFQGSQDGFWDWNVTNGHILRSQRWYEILGYAPDDIAPGLGGFNDIVHPDDRATAEKMQAAIFAGEDWFSYELRLRAKSGEWKWILDRGKVVARDETGRPLRISGTHTDITTQRRAKEESDQLHRRMQETQRLESLGVLAGGIAHDFNNLLTVILGNTSLVRLDHRTTPETLGRLEKITTAANRAADLCRQLLAYAGKGAYTIERLRLDQVVRDTTHLLELSLNPRARLEFDFSSDLPAVEADPSQMQQIIMNLVLNASEAIGENPGRIRISTHRVELVRGELLEALPAGDHPAGPYARLEISDTGCGMTPEVRARIFDPFFTTKFTGRGLGLAAVLGIVRAHRGALTVRSRPGEGTTFRIYLPATTGADHAVPSSSATPFQLHPAGTYLVVDDDPSVRALIAEMLTRQGHEVVTADSGDAAVPIFTARPERFTAALIDLTMPGKNGHETLQELRRQRPDLPCVLLSGYTEHEARNRPHAGDFSAFLQKPFTPESLNACLVRATMSA